MTRYTIYCTPEQTKKALELGAPIDNSSNNFDSDCADNIELLSNGLYAIIPTAEEMIGWLRSKGIQFHFDDETGYWCIEDANDDLPPLRWFGYSNKKELDAIDAALDYLTNDKKAK